MSNGGAPSGHRGGDDLSRKPELPFVSAWMSHWSGAACCGPKLSLRHEAEDVGSSGRSDMQGTSGFVDGRENLMLALAPSGSRNWDSKSGKQIEAFHEKDRASASSWNRPILDFPSSPTFPDDELHRLPNHRCMNLFPIENTSREGNLFRGFYNWPHGVPRMPSSSHDVETMRIFTTIDTIAGSSRGAPTFSQTTRHFMFSKTDLNVSRGECSTPPDFNEKALREFLTLSTEALVSPANEKNKLIGDSRNESSTETEVLDMKDGKEESNLPISLFLATPFKEERIEGTDTRKEVPAQTDILEEDDASTSRTESLDAEHLVSNSSMKSVFTVEKEMNPECKNRWVKRLKPSSSMAFAYGTKSAGLEEGSLKTKSQCLFSKVLRCDKSESEGKKAVESAASPVTLVDKWIKRWRPIGSSFGEKSEEKRGVQRTEEDDVMKEEKQFPSIAAMALMGKAMNGLRQCAFRKRGSVMLWNTDDDDDEVH